jgi:hypothetical protein
MAGWTAVLEGVGRLLDASGLEDLFDGSDDEVGTLHAVLADIALGARGQRYTTVCWAARRRCVTPAYVCNRAAALLAALDARRQADLYRLLGVAPLASAEELSGRWDELVRTAHPRMGGDPARFRDAKEAWEVLRHPERRAEYERWWVRALGPFQRVPGAYL